VHSNDVLVTHDFATTEQAADFARDPELKRAWPGRE
jgi:hypothetical protein